MCVCVCGLYYGFTDDTSVKELPANAGDMRDVGSFPG